MRYSQLLRSLLFLILLSAPFLGQAQKRLRYTSEVQRGKRVDGTQFTYLIDNVVITQENTVIRADSAIIRRQENQAEAFGRIRVKEGDSVNIVSKRLVYDGNSGTASMFDDVVYNDGKATLYTDHLDYNKFTGISRYYEGGRMVDDENTLNSIQGIFDKNRNQASFFGDVLLQTPDATITADTLYYNTLSGQATFVGPMRIVRTDGTITESEEGLVYNTQSENTAILQGFVENKDYIIKGRRLRYDKPRNRFTAEGNVTMTAKNQDVIITGEHGYYDRTTGYTYIWGNPVMRKPVQNDTLFLSADTLVSIDGATQEDKRLLAFHSVKIFKTDLQGVADSMAYKVADSLLLLYTEPVLWNEQNQMTGDTVGVQIRNNKLDRLTLMNNGFVVSEDSLGYYNQLKGRLVTAFFNDSTINEVAVNGNGESIYYVQEENDTTLVGMNRLTCGNMLIEFRQSAVHGITYYQKPDAVFYPPHEMSASLMKLDGFNWQDSRRPTKAQVLAPNVKAPEKETSANANSEGDSQPENKSRNQNSPANRLKSGLDSIQEVPAAKPATPTPADQKNTPKSKIRNKPEDD